MTMLPNIKLNQRFKVVMASGTMQEVVYRPNIFYEVMPFDVIVRVGNGHSFSTFEFMFNGPNVEQIMQIALFEFIVRDNEWRMLVGNDATMFRVLRFKNLESALLFKLSYVE